MSADTDLIAELRNGRFVTWLEALDWCNRAADRIASMEAALAPFAREGRSFDAIDAALGFDPSPDGRDVRLCLKLGDLRRAAALSSSKQKDGGE
jgi:hypothetical protein